MKIKFHFMPILGALIFVLPFIGCTSTVTSLQEVEVSSMPNRSSIRITENRKPQSLEVRANASFNKSKVYETYNDGHTDVNQYGKFEVEPVQGEQYFLEREGVNTEIFSGNNVRWLIPNWQGSLDIDLKTSENFALTGGVHYSELDGNAYWGENIGIAFLGESERYGYRLDFNGRFNQSKILAEVVIRDEEFTNGTRSVWFLNESFDADYFNFGMMFTLNTKNRDWLLNFFFNYSLAWQTLYNIDKEDFKRSRGEYDNFNYSESYHTLSAGIYKTIAEGGRIIAGARLMKYTDKKNNFTMPDFFVQYDFILF